MWALPKLPGRRTFSASGFNPEAPINIMSDPKKNHRLTYWITFMVMFVLFSWLFVYWREFKTGIMEGYTSQTKQSR